MVLRECGCVLTYTGTHTCTLTSNSKLAYIRSIMVCVIQPQCVSLFLVDSIGAIILRIVQTCFTSLFQSCLLDSLALQVYFSRIQRLTLQVYFHADSPAFLCESILVKSIRRPLLVIIFKSSLFGHEDHTCMHECTQYHTATLTAPFGHLAVFFYRW